MLEIRNKNCQFNLTLKFSTLIAKITNENKSKAVSSKALFK